MKKRFIVIFIVIILAAVWSGGKEFLSNNKKSEVYTGMVEAKAITVKSEVSGEMEKIYGSEGDSIEEDQLLYDLDDTDYKIEREKALQNINISKSKIKDLEEGYSIEEIEQLKAKISQNYSNILTLDEERLNLEDRYNQMIELKDAGAVSENDVKDIKLALEKVKYELSGLRFAEEELELKLRDMENGMDKNQIDISKGELKIAELNLENAESTIDKCHRKSPIAGILEEIYYDEGEFIPAGSSVLSIVDFDDVWVEAYVEEKNLAILELGKIVDLKPYGTEKTIQGKISYISRNGEFTPKNIESKENKEEIVYKVKVVAYEKTNILKPGMFVDLVISK